MAARENQKKGQYLAEQVLHAGLFAANHNVLYSTASVWLKSCRMPLVGPGFGYGDRDGRLCSLGRMHRNWTDVWRGVPGDGCA